MRIEVIIAVAFAALLSGCASVTRGTTDQLQIQSEPAGAEARTSMGHVCTTPCTLQVNRKDEFVVSVTKPGYNVTEVPVTTRVGGGGAAGFAGNILLGGVVGMAADAATGATLDHFPNPVIAHLVPVAKGQKPKTIREEPKLPEQPEPTDTTPQSGV